MAEASVKKEDSPIRRLTRDKINEQYKRGYITHADREELLQKKAHDEIFQGLEKDGFIMTALSQWSKEINDHWQTMKEVATKNPDTFDPGTNAMIGGWTAFQMFVSGLTALGKTVGHENERIALALGIDPGAARIINIMSDIGSSAVPIGKLVKSVARTAEHATGQLGAKETAASAQKLLQEQFEKDRAKRIIQEGLNASMTTEERFAASAGKRNIVEATPGFKPTTPEASQIEAPLSVQQRIATSVKAAENKVTNKEADKIVSEIAKREGIDLSTMFQDKNYTNKQMYAYLTVLRPHIDELQDLAKKAASGESADRYAFAKYVSDLANASPTGATGKPVTDFHEMLLHWDADSMAKGDIVGAIQTMAKDFAVLDKNELRNLTLGIQKDISGGAEAATVWEKGKSVYRNMLLPFAWSSSFIGNSVALGQHETERVMGKMFASESGVVPNLSGAAKDAYYFNKGMTLAIGDASAAFKDSFKGAVPGELSRFDTMRPAFNSKLGRIIETPQDAVRGVDNFFNLLINRASNYAQAMAWVEKRGIKGTDEAGQIILDRARFIPEEMMSQSNQISKELTFQSQLGWIGRGITKFTQGTPAFLYGPFMKSYINIAKYEWARTPGLQLISTQLYKDLASGGPAAELAVGKLIMGNLQGMMYYQMAKEGYVTGSGPTDPKLRAEWLVDHQPYSVKTPAGWVSYKNLEPITAPLGFMADLAQVSSYVDQPSLEQAFMAVSYATINNFAGGNWWKTGADLVDSIQEMRAGKGLSEKSVAVLSSPVTAITSGGVGGQRLEKILDPALRETRGLVDELMAKTPFFSTGLRAMTDPYGNPMTLPQTPGNPLFGLVAPWARVKPFPDDRVVQEGQRLRAKLPNTNDHFMGGYTVNPGSIQEGFPEDRTGIQLDQLEQTQRVMLFQQMWKDPKVGIEASLLNDMRPGGYNDKTQTTRAGQKFMFESAMQQYWDAAGKSLVIRNPAVGRRYIESLAKPFYPMMTPDVQDREKANVENQIRLFETMTPAERENFLRWDPPPSGGDVTPPPQSIQMGPQGLIK